MTDRGSLTTLSRAIREAVAICLARAFDPNPGLSLFLPAEEFRSIQLQMSFLISGSFAYHFLRQTTFCNAYEMDIYIHEAHFIRLAELLVAWGYSVRLPGHDSAKPVSVLRSDLTWYNEDGLDNMTCGIFRFVRQDAGQSTTRTIVVTVATMSPIMCLLNEKSSM